MNTTLRYILPFDPRIWVHVAWWLKVKSKTNLCFPDSQAIRYRDTIMLLVSVTHKCSVAIERCYHSNPLVNHPITILTTLTTKKGKEKPTFSSGLKYDYYIIPLGPEILLYLVWIIKLDTRVLKKHHLGTYPISLIRDERGVTNKNRSFLLIIMSDYGVLTWLLVVSVSLSEGRR